MAYMKKQLLILLALFSSQCMVIAAGKKPVIIGIVADVQYAKGVQDNIGRHYSEGIVRLREAIDYFNSVDDLSLIVDLGDMTDRNYSDYGEISAVKKEARARFCNVLGNHDFFPATSIEEMEEVIRLKDLKKPYYSIVKGNIRFIFLHSGDIATYSRPKDSRELKQAEQWMNDLLSINAKSARDYNGGIGLEQLKWLDSELSAADARKQYAIILCHMTMLPFDTYESLWNSMEVVHLIESHHCAKAVFCGHRHSGGYSLRNGIHYVNFKGMVEGENNRFAVVTINPVNGTIIIKGHGDENDHHLQCR